MASAYERLVERFRGAALLGEAGAILGWDHATIMPSGAAAGRAEQLAYLGRLRQEMLSAPTLGDDLAAAEADEEALDDWRRANLGEMRRIFRIQQAVPVALNEALTRANSASEMCWREARPANDFARQRPHLEKVLALVREAATARGEAFGLSVHDTLLDAHEAGLRLDRVTAILDELAQFLPDLVDRALARQGEAPPALPLEGNFPRARQRELAERLMRVLGFDFEHGRLDESHHPFTGGVRDDSRITTRYDEADPWPSVLAVLHETGHALYGQGLPLEWRYQPVGASLGMAIHESQSLIIEMQACRGPEFLSFVAPEVRRALGVDGPAWTAENLARHAHGVARSLIRVDADEVTYPLHIILRHRLEVALLSGDLAMADLPGAWNELHEELIGIRPPDDADGCLQDIHWMGGSFGYFPTYTLGAIAAAQLFEVAEAAGEVRAPLARGDFRPLLAWLRENVHRHGRLPGGAETLLTRATGRSFDVATFRRHLEARYG